MDSAQKPAILFLSHVSTTVQYVTVLNALTVQILLTTFFLLMALLVYYVQSHIANTVFIINTLTEIYKVYNFSLQLKSLMKQLGQDVPNATQDIVSILIQNYVNKYRSGFLTVLNNIVMPDRLFVYFQVCQIFNLASQYNNVIICWITVLFV